MCPISAVQVSFSNTNSSHIIEEWYVYQIKPAGVITIILLMVS